MSKRKLGRCSKCGRKTGLALRDGKWMCLLCILKEKGLTFVQQVV